MKALRDEKRAPRMIVLENVKGALTSHGGKDFAAIGAALSKEDYRFGGNETYHLAGDGVAVPVVRFLAAHILEPIIAPTVSDQLAV
jgi:site-specific DNA-cytosine methylase